MVLGIGALASLGLALPTGMAFGYGYGYGVRAGYNAYKQPSSEVRKLKLSANPVTGALGAGLQSAEERTGVVAGVPVMKTPEGITGQEPSLAASAAQLTTDKKQWTQPDLIYNKAGTYSIKRSDQQKMTREQFRNWMNGNYNWYYRGSKPFYFKRG